MTFKSFSQTFRITVLPILTFLVSATASADESVLTAEGVVYSPALVSRAESGNTAAQNALGVAYQKGYGTEADQEKAAYWFGRAAESDNPSGMVNLGSALLKGEGVDKDVSAALALFQQAADLGSQAGIFNLSTMYYKGLGVEKNQKKAFDLALQASEMSAHSFVLKDGSRYEATSGPITGKALMFVAMCYRKGEGVEKDFEKSMHYAGLAAESGNPEGSLVTAIAADSGAEGVVTDRPRVERYYRTAADAGYAQAQYILGSRYATGHTFKKNDTEARRYLEMAVANNRGLPPIIKADALLKLATLLEATGLDEDRERAATIRSEARKLPEPDEATINKLIFD